MKFDRLQVCRFDDVVPVPWKNRGGVTRELIAWSSAEDWSLRLSVADIERSGVFSAFNDVDRWFAVIDGEGVRLSGGIGEVRRGYAPVAFDGALAPECQLIADTTRDLNFMVNRKRGTGKLCQLSDRVRANGDYVIDAKGAMVIGIFSATACEVVISNNVVNLDSMSAAWCDKISETSQSIQVRTGEPERTWCFTFSANEMAP